jgi:hypothetical protein
MDARKGGKEVVGLNSGVFNNTSFASFSNLQDLPFFESLASLGDFSSLAAFQSFPSIPEHLFEEARAAVAAAAANGGTIPGQQGSSSNLALGRNDSFSNLTQSSLHNLQLFLSEVEQGVNATNQSATPPPSTTTQPSPTNQPQHRNHAQQAPQPLPAAATASYTAQIPSPAARGTALPPLKAGPAPTPIAPAPYPSPAQFAAFSPSLGAYPQYPSQPQQWGPPLSRQPMPQGKPPASAASSPMMQSPGGPPAVVPPEFSNTLYSLASTLPPPMVLSNDSVLGSVGGGLHFQRHCVRRRMPDELGQDPSMFLN